MNPFDLSGPQFLLFYAIFSGIVISALVFRRRRAELLAAPPRIDLADPYLIAYLRGGEKEVAVVRKYARPGEASRTSRHESLGKACESYDKTLRRARLLPDEYVTRARLVRLVIAGLLLGGVALTKLLVALAAGRSNVGFLIVLAIASIVIATAVSFPRLTESGKAVLEDAKSLYGGLQDRAALSKQRDAGVEPMMMAAVFGVGALSATGFSVAGAERKKKADGSCATDGDCGSSDSGSSSSDSGSSCNSVSSSSSCSSGSSCGSSCGGGCGGCGGS